MSKKDDMFLSDAELQARHSEVVGELHAQLREKDRQLDSYRKGHGSIQAAFEVVRTAIPSIAPAPTAYKEKKTKVASPCSVVFAANDWHYGAVQETSEIEGFGEFSPDIAAQRVMAFAYQLIKWVNVHRVNYTIPELVILGLGDLISGDIHAELQRTNAWPAPIQAVKAGELLANLVAVLAPLFNRVRVEFIVADNHARLTKKPQAKEEGMNTLNYVVGAYAKQSLWEHKNVEFNMYPLHEKIVRVAGQQYLCSHGHNVKGWAGIPWYGHERTTAREATARLQIIMQDLAKAREIGFHKRIFAHWHTPLSFPLYWGMPSIQGTDAYDHKSGRHSDPAISAWLVHPKHGEFDRTDFNLN